MYNLNVGGDSGWWSTASDFSLTISENTTLAIGQVEIAGAPQGTADVALDVCGPAKPLARVGAAFQVSCRLSDRGAVPVQGLSLSLSLPSDGSVTIVSSPAVPSSVSNGYGGPGKVLGR